jgi:hypothetical protein
MALLSSAFGMLDFRELRRVEISRQVLLRYLIERHVDSIGA